MKETELLDALDRRARRAVEALEDATAGEAPPAPVPAGGAPGRRWMPLLVAAALVVVALAGAGLLLGGGEEDGTVAGEADVVVETDPGAPARVALADPAALGFRIRAVFDGSANRPVPEHAGEPVLFVAHAPAGSERPWDAAIVATRYPFDDQQLIGEVIDVGGPLAVRRQLASSQQVQWRDGEVVHMLMSTRVEAAALLDVARAAVASGWDGAGPLPGHEIIHQGTSADVQAAVEFAASGPTPWRGIAYDHRTGDRDFVIGWRPGDADTLRAMHALQPTRRAQIAGTEVLISESLTGFATQASWMAADDTVAQIATYGDVDALLEEVFPALTPVRDDELDSLAEEHPLGTDGTLLERSATSGLFGDDQPELASVTARDGSGNEHRVTLLERADGGGFALMTESEVASGISGSGGPVADLDAPFLQAGGSSSAPGGEPLTPVVVSGLVPAELADAARSASVVDRTTGAELRVAQVVLGEIPDSDSQLLVLLVDADPAVARVEITFPTAGGAVTWRL